MKLIYNKLESNNGNALRKTEITTNNHHMVIPDSEISKRRRRRLSEIASAAQGHVFLRSRWPAAGRLSVRVLCFCPAADLIYGSRWAAYSGPFVADCVAEKKDGGGHTTSSV